MRVKNCKTFQQFIRAKPLVKVIFLFTYVGIKWRLDILHLCIESSNGHVHTIWPIVQFPVLIYTLIRTVYSKGTCKYNSLEYLPKSTFFHKVLNQVIKTLYSRVARNFPQSKNELTVLEVLNEWYIVIMVCSLIIFP